MSQNENKKELVATLVPEYEKLEGKIRACADIKIYYGETKLTLNDVNYSLYFDDVLVRSFLDVTDIEEGWHEFKAVIEYNGITKIIVATKKYNKYGNDNKPTNNNKIKQTPIRYIVRRRFPLNTAEINQVYYTSAIKITNSDGITPHKLNSIINNIIESIFNDEDVHMPITSESIKNHIRNIQIAHADDGNTVNNYYNADKGTNFLNNYNKVYTVVIHLHKPYYIIKKYNGLRIFKDNSIKEYGQVFRTPIINIPDWFTSDINYKIRLISVKNSGDRDKIGRFKVSIDKRMDVKRYVSSYGSYKNNIGFKCYRWKYIFRFATKIYGNSTYDEIDNKIATPTIIKVRFKTCCNNYTDWYYYVYIFRSNVYKLITKKKKLRQTKSDPVTQF